MPEKAQRPSHDIPTCLVYVFICKLFYPLRRAILAFGCFWQEVERTKQDKAKQDRFLICLG
jgi:hypothetical protein